MEMEIGELYLALAAKSTHGRSFASKSFAGKSMASETFVSSVTEKRASGGPVVRVRCADAGTPKPRPAKGWPLIPGSKTFRVILFRQRPNRPNSCVRTDRFRQQPPLTDPLRTLGITAALSSQNACKHRHKLSRLDLRKIRKNCFLVCVVTILRRPSESIEFVGVGHHIFKLA